MKKTLFAIFFCVLLLFVFSSCNESEKPSSNSSNDNMGSSSNDLFKKNHTVTLVIDAFSNKKITIDDGKALTINFTPTKDSYIFKGWYTDSACTVPYDFSQPVKTSFNLYAGFTLRTKTIRCQNIEIKALSSKYENSQSFGLSLVGFDYDYLEDNGMGLQFKITYNVKYTKDYEVPFDIGYAGSPEHEVSLLNSSLQTYSETNLPTTKSEVKRCYTYNTPLYFSKDEQIVLSFSTDNIQNIVSFSDIVVVIEAIRLR